MNTLLKTAIALIFLLPGLNSLEVNAQSKTVKTVTSTKDVDKYDYTHVIPDSLRDTRFIYSDTITVSGSEITKRDSTITDPHRVVTNGFGRNWFVFATGGAHTFIGDYSKTAGFGGTISPDWGVGIGKWFTPGIALKVEFIRSNSRGYTQYLTGHYGYGGLLLNDKGEPYRLMKTSWWDISGSVLLNFTRLFLGYEGYNSPRRMNQVMGAIGFGGVHHLGYKHLHGSDNEWSGHLELQYSRFFTPKKQFSLDVKLRGIFYQTNFDLEYGGYVSSSNKWDSNVGVDLGFTYYIGKARLNSWGSKTTTVYNTDYRRTEILQIREKPMPIAEMRPTKELKVISFYVFYPNNYSGRNDAPQVASSKVNAIDYLAGGIFTQKRFKDTDQISSLLNAGINPRAQEVEDIPTVVATCDVESDGVPHGYEMHGEGSGRPLSLSMAAGEMNRYKDRNGYYYAPIWDDLHLWGYRIDRETYGQQLVSSANYQDTHTYGINAHQGLPIIEEWLNVHCNEYLVSFADVYAALNGNEGFIAQFTDPATVEMIREVFQKGIFSVVEAHGVATSQDNYSGQNAKAVGIQRNQELANNRAQTVIQWLTKHPALKDAHSLVYIDECSDNMINPVSSPSTRGLEAKLNRCVKVSIQVVY